MEGFMELEDRFRIEDESFRARAEEELRETDERRTAALATLKKLLADDPRIHATLADEILLMYLRTTKYYVDAAFARVKRLSQVMLHPLVKLWLPKSHIDNMLSVFSQPWVTIPENFDEHGRKIVSIEAGKWEPDKVSLADLLVTAAFVLIALTLDQRVQVGGYVLVLDVKGVTFRHVRHVTTSFLKLLGILVRECCPIRVKQVHVVNVSKIVRKLINVLFPLIGKKLRNRVQIHGNDFAPVHAHVPLALLPKEFGGTCEDITQSSYVRDQLERAEAQGVFQGIRELTYN